MDSQMGTPPDAFTEEGQNWQFPMYVWEEHVKEKFTWYGPTHLGLGKASYHFLVTVTRESTSREIVSLSLLYIWPSAILEINVRM
jgi:hypothetical protein